MLLRIFRAITVASCLVFSAIAHAEDSHAGYATVNQWATILWHQDANGTDIAGTKVERENLPGFVHRAYVGANQTRTYAQDFTASLERANTYFHPPAATTQPLVLDVEASFQRGLLDAYYPYAIQPGEAAKSGNGDRTVTKENDSLIQWKGVRVGDQADTLVTTSSAWQAARAVGSAATLKVYKPSPAGSKSDDEGTTEGDVFLFYSGAGAIPSPISVTSKSSVLHVALRDATIPLSVSSAWLLSVRQDGMAAFRHLGQLDNRTSSSIEVASDFASGSYSALGSDELQAQLREALNAEGLPDDEAAAMLASLNSRFSEAGQRVLFLLPQSWTDAALPLQVRGPGQVAHRIMLGRIELATNETAR